MDGNNRTIVLLDLLLAERKIGDKRYVEIPFDHFIYSTLFRWLSTIMNRSLGVNIAGVEHESPVDSHGSYRVCRYGHRNRQHRRLYGQEDKLPVSLCGNRLFGLVTGMLVMALSLLLMK